MWSLGVLILRSRSQRTLCTAIGRLPIREYIHSFHNTRFYVTPCEDCNNVTPPPKESSEDPPSKESSEDMNEDLLMKLSHLGGDHLETIIHQLTKRNELESVAKQQGITGKIYEDVLNSFSSLLLNPEEYSDNQSLLVTMDSIYEGRAHVDNLFPHFIDHAHKCYPMLYIMPQLKKISDLTSPAQWYLAARSMQRHFVIHAGPTNSGKTHEALKAFYTAGTGIYCAPLRMLASEIYQQSNEKGVACDLVTGEERLYGNGDKEKLAGHVSCTVEMSNTSIGTEYDVAVIDESQMIRDKDRGGAWTRAILGVPAKEVHLCGEATMIPLITRLLESLGDTVQVKNYKRLSPLVPLNRSLGSKYHFISPGDCIVAFSRRHMFTIKRDIERSTKHTCAIIYGGLPSANRQEQAKLFNSSSSNVNVMVATDAIGMGVNLKIKRMIFYSLEKSDGKRIRYITPSHAKQIAGRAGRYGSFSKGEVTTFHHDDLSTLHQFLSFDIQDIKRAGLTPRYEQLQLFSNVLPKLKLHDLLSVFSTMAKLDDNYFLCEAALRDWMDKSQAISEYGMDLQTLYTFSISPIAINTPYFKKVFCEFARYSSKDLPLSFSDLKQILELPHASPTTSVDMIRWEDTHEILDLYLWFNQRFSHIFPDDVQVRSLQRKIQKVIADNLLLKSPRSSKLRLLKQFPRKSKGDDPLIISPYLKVQTRNPSLTRSFKNLILNKKFKK